VTTPASKTMRVERVLRLLPDVDALAPLRAFLMATSRRNSHGGSQHTVGKRYLSAEDLPGLVPRALRRVTEHLTLLYDSAIEALEAEDRGDAAACVQAFIRGGDLESRVGRDNAARQWYEHALVIAEGGHDRKPEIEVLQRLGALDAALGDFDRAARVQQRSFVLAESEGVAPSAASAAIALGEAALRRENFRGAASWFSRALEHAADEPWLLGRLALGQAALATATSDIDAAEAHLQRAEMQFNSQGPEVGRTELLSARGRLAARRGNHAEALAHFREALVRLPVLERDPHVDLAIRLEISQLFLDTDRLPDAEDEIRRTEELAIVHNFSRDLARVYILLGEVRARQRDETGFVFFEKAIELSRQGDPAPRLEAEAYLAYSHFRSTFGEMEEARACLERALEIVDVVHDPLLEHAVETSMARLGRG
jgi:tetratricopeptide (TPR) repeat protein